MELTSRNMENKKYTVGQHVFIISNNSYVMEMVILRISGDFYTLRSVDQGSGTRLKGHRIYATKEDAQKVLDEETKKRNQQNLSRSKRWYD